MEAKIKKSSGLMSQSKAKTMSQNTRVRVSHKHLHLLCDLPGADHNINVVVTWAAAGTGAAQFNWGGEGGWEVRSGGKSTGTERGDIGCTMLPSTGKSRECAVRQELAR